MKKIYLPVYDGNDCDNITYIQRRAYCDRQKAISSIIQSNLWLYEKRDESFWNEIRKEIPNDVPKKNPYEIFDYIVNAEEPPRQNLDEGYYYIYEILLEE